MPTSIADRFKVIDTDTHVVEPPDLWTSRIKVKNPESIPHVRPNPDKGEDYWYVNGIPMAPVGAPAQAGWHEYPPNHPKTFTEIDPALWDSGARLLKMDEYGIWCALLYPNVALFSANTISSREDSGLALDLMRVYNDYQSEFVSVDPERYVALTALPFWDLNATLAEIDRCSKLGHRGIVFSQDPSAFGLPGLTSRHWDPMWALAQEKGLPVNFHIASGDVTLYEAGGGDAENGRHANFASMGVSFFMGNARTIAQLTCGGVCHRFPQLNFVSVESGIGWLPFALDSLDWQWKNCGVAIEHPEYELLPSEYFRRQIYGSFWFETETALSAIEWLGADNIMFETDYPHSTSMSPGPASAAINPRDYLESTFTSLPDDILSKILHDNAARIYHLG